MSVVGTSASNCGVDHHLLVSKQIHLKFYLMGQIQTGEKIDREFSLLSMLNSCITMEIIRTI